jgi:protein-disulfide isomerase-like protein with CxxC motif
MALNRNLNALDARFKPIAEYIIKAYRLVAKKELKVIETKRSQAVQSAYYAQGRESLESVNQLRKIADIYPITAEQNKKTITNVQLINTKESHGAGLAMDVMPEDGFDSDIMYWNKIGDTVELARQLFKNRLDELNAVIVWGGNWKMKDMPHIQLIINEEKKIV